MQQLIKLRERTKSTSFDKFQKCPRNYRRTLKQYAIAHKTVRKDQIHEFSLLPKNALETVDGPQNNIQQLIKLRERTKSTSFDKYQKCPRNSRRTRKQYAIAHETSRKDQIHEFSLLPKMRSKLSFVKKFAPKKEGARKKQKILPKKQAKSLSRDPLQTPTSSLQGFLTLQS